MKENKRWLIALCIAVLILCGVLTGAYVADVRAQRNARDRAETVLIDSAREQAITFASTLSGRFQVLKSISSGLSLSGYQDSGEIEAVLASIVKDAGLSFSKVNLVYADGAKATEDADYHYIFSDREYFARAMSGESAMELVVGKVSGDKCVVMSVPYKRDGKIVGVLCGLLYEEDLRELLISQAYGGMGYSFLVRGNGDVVINAEAEASQVKGDSIFDKFKDATFSNGDSLDRLRQAMQDGRGETLNYRLGKDARVAVAVPLSSGALPQNDWYVLNVVSESSLLSEVATSRRSSLESMSIFAAFAVGALLLFAVLERDYRRKKDRQAEAVRQREEQFRIVTEQSGKQVLRYDIPTQTAYRSDSTDGDGLLGAGFVERAIQNGYIDAASADDYRAFFARIDAGESPVSANILTHLPDGSLRWFRHDATTIRDQSGKPATAIISYYDDTEQRERELAYAKWQQELGSVSYDSAALYEWNLTKDIPDGQRGRLATDYTALGDAQRSFNSRTKYFSEHFVLADDRAAFDDMMNRERLIAMYFNKEYRRDLDYRYIGDGGEVTWRRISVQLVPYPDNQDLKAYVTNRDIDAEKREELMLLERSQQDTMTGVFNRETFIERVNELIARSPESTHAILMLDVDGFKQVNDQLGHGEGDSVLIDFSRRIRTALRSSDIVGRIGGDEFMACLPDMPFDAAIGKKAQQLCATLYHKLGEHLAISASIGVAVYPRDGQTFEELYLKADTALYFAKSRGKDKYEFFRPEMDEPDARASGMLSDVRPPSLLRGVLVATNDDNQFGELSALIGDEFTIERADTVEAFQDRVGRANDAVTVIVDADTAFGGECLAALGARDSRHTVLALTANHSDDATIRILSAGASSIISKPVSQLILRLRLEKLIAARSSELSELQSAYSRLQNVDDMRYREVLRSTGTTVFVYDLATRAYQADLLGDSATDIEFGGYDLSGELMRRGVLDAEAADKLRGDVARVENGEATRLSRDIRLRVRGDKPRWYRVSIIKMENVDTLTPKLLITAVDVHEQVVAEEKLRYRAERDALTGLYNRETFFEKAAELIAAREAGAYVMTCFDVDNFKVINDQYGTDKGDEALRYIADVFQQGFSAVGGICCRVMADNFAVLYPREFMDTDGPELIRRKASDIPMLNITFSIGRYIVDDKRLSVSAMFDRATIAETSVKGRFDAHVAQYDESMRERILSEQEIINDMNAALAGGQFEAWYQPQYNHSTGALIGAEALVRWRHPVKGLLPPARFIPVFERNGFIYELDKHVWELVCRKLREWLDAGRAPLPVSVNVSRYDVFRDDFYDVITGLVERYNVPVELLRLEITESAFAKSSAQIISMVKRLNDFGFTIEIDDFGSGYSSLNTLKDVPASILKLDMRFLEGADNSQRGGNIVESVVRMAKWLGMPVIAEGVETLAQADYLKSIGCFYVQGYLYAKPMPVAEYEALAAGSGKEKDMSVLETVERMDNNAFWDPSSMQTLIFNSYVGGACIFEWKDGSMELLRANDKYARELGGEGMTVEEALRIRVEEHLDEENLQIVMENIRRAISTGEEATCEACLCGVGSGHMYVRSTVRAIARAGDRTLLYCSVKNTTAQRESERRILETSEQLRFLNAVARDLLSETDSDEAVSGMLHKVLGYFHGDLAYVYEFDRIARVAHCTGTVRAAGREHALPRSVSFDEIDRWMTELDERGHLSLSAGEGMPLIPGSLVAVPLRRDGRMMGFMAVENPREASSHVDHLEALGDYMAVVLTHRDLTARIENDDERLRRAHRDG